MSSTDLNVDWNLCPTEILFVIFENLDITSLRCCSLVNNRWKELVYHLCEVKHLWKEFAQDGIANYAEPHRNKSTLSWKELYHNTLLWNDVESATITKVNEIERLFIKNISVYRDNIIIVSSTDVQYYNVETFEFVRNISVTCDWVEETDSMVIVAIRNSDYFKLLLFGKLDKNDDDGMREKVEQHFNGEFHCDTWNFDRLWRWKVQDDTCYVIDFKYILWKARRIKNRWSVKLVARYYGQNSAAVDNSISVMHVSKDDVYVAFRFGCMMRVLKNDMQFCTIGYPMVPTRTLTAQLSKNKFKHGLIKFNAFLKAPFGVGFEKEITDCDLMHFCYDDWTLSCGTQHGEVVFLGYYSGNVSIFLLKDSSQSVRNFNIKDYDKRELHDPAVIGLDVCELKDKHVLFVKTLSKVYQLLITYPKRGQKAGCESKRIMESSM